MEIVYQIMNLRESGLFSFMLLTKLGLWIRSLRQLHIKFIGSL